MKKVNKSLIIFCFLTLYILLLKNTDTYAQNQKSNVLFSKEIFKSRDFLSFSENYTPAEHNIYKILIKLNAVSHSDYYIDIDSEYFSNGKLLLGKAEIQDFTSVLKTYTEWHEIVEQKNVEVEKVIDSFNISKKNIAKSEMGSSIRKIDPLNRYKTVVYKFFNERLEIIIKGDIPVYHLSYGPEVDYYRYGNIYSISIHHKEVSSVYNVLTGEKFEELIKEAGEKLDVWDELKR